MDEQSGSVLYENKEYGSIFPDDRLRGQACLLPVDCWFCLFRLFFRGRFWPGIAGRKPRYLSLTDTRGPPSTQHHFPSATTYVRPRYRRGGHTHAKRSRKVKDSSPITEYRRIPRRGPIPIPPCFELACAYASPFCHPRIFQPSRRQGRYGSRIFSGSLCGGCHPSHSEKNAIMETFSPRSGYRVCDSGWIIAEGRGRDKLWDDP